MGSEFLKIRGMSSKSFSIIVSIEGQEAARHDLVGDVLSLGRGPDNDIQVLVSEVSVKHAELRVSGDTVKIVDIGSTNGTKLNGRPVSKEGADLSAMDKLELGETVPAYFVPSETLESTPIAELIKSIESSPKSEVREATAPISVVAPAKPAALAAPAPVAAGGATTVKLSKVRPTDGPALPAVAAPGAPTPVKPGTLKPATIAEPVAPASPVKPGVIKPATPVAPPTPAGGAPGGKPVAPVPLKRPGAAGGPTAPPSIPLPAKKVPPSQ